MTTYIRSDLDYECIDPPIPDLGGMGSMNAVQISQQERRPTHQSGKFLFPKKAATHMGVYWLT